MFLLDKRKQCFSHKHQEARKQQIGKQEGRPFSQGKKWCLTRVHNIFNFEKSSQVICFFRNLIGIGGKCGCSWLKWTRSNVKLWVAFGLSLITTVEDIIYSVSVYLLHHTYRRTLLQQSDKSGGRLGKPEKYLLEPEKRRCKSIIHQEAAAMARHCCLCHFSKIKMIPACWRQTKTHRNPEHCKWQIPDQDCYLNKLIWNNYNTAFSFSH